MDNLFLAAVWDSKVGPSVSSDREEVMPFLNTMCFLSYLGTGNKTSAHVRN
jgi:hypothetical protein